MISQTRDAHASIERVLADVRNSRAKQAAEAHTIAPSELAGRITLRAYRVQHIGEKSKPVAQLNNLVQLIQRLVAPNVWNSGDGRHSIEIIDDALMIQTTNVNHRQIQRALMQLGFDPGAYGHYGGTGIQEWMGEGYVPVAKELPK